MDMQAKHILYFTCMYDIYVGFVQIAICLTMDFGVSYECSMNKCMELSDLWKIFMLCLAAVSKTFFIYYAFM